MKIPYNSILNKTERLLAFLACITILLAATVTTAAAEGKKFTLVIDAGHGGKDAGALGKYSKEKNINLKVALAFGRYVEQNCSDVRVIYTRKTDVFIPLHERADIANRNKADVFISIHTNAIAGRKKLTGLETYTMGMRRSEEKLSAAMRENDVVLIEDNFQQHYAGFDPRSPESYIIFEMINDANMLESVNLAKKIQKNVCRSANRPNKGVKQDAFLVLRETSMPACLIELGYITTPSEEAYLNDKTNVDALGRGIYQAFIEFKAERTGKAVATPQPTPAHQQSQTTPASQESQQLKESQSAQPVFKVQFLTSERKLKAGDSRLKGIKDADCYKEGALWKYTVGSSTNYTEILQLRRRVAKNFPQAFVIAFREGKRMDLEEAKKMAGVR